MLCEANQLTCEGDETIGSTILLSAIEKPFIQILLNAGILKYHNILSAVEGSFSNLDKENYGYNIKTGEYIDMVEEGIIDPTKVTRTALENAVSVAGTMLITECTIVDDPEDDKEADPMSMMGM
jgi:chaperonin GroEL